MRRRIICEDDPWTELFWKFTKFNRFRGYFRDSFSVFFSFVFAASLSDLEFIRSMRETGERVE